MDSLIKSISCFLRYRDFPGDICPFPNKKRFFLEKGEQAIISNSNDLDSYLTKYFNDYDFSKTGIFLSGGIDSVIMASYCPRGMYAFTVRYPEYREVDEADRAKFFADKFGLKLIVVDVTFDDVLRIHDKLSVFKKRPLSSIEIGLFAMCEEAKKRGLKNIITGMGGDGLCGGFFNLLSKKWTNDEFVKRFTYLEPSIVLKKYDNCLEFFEKHFGEPYFDMMGFLDDVEDSYTLSYFLSSIEFFNLKLVAPYENCVRNFPINVEDLLNGNEKPVLRQLYKKRTNEEFVGRKYPMPRPTKIWQEKYGKIMNDEFYDDAYQRCSNPEQKWIVYTCDRFISLFKQGEFNEE